MTSALKSDELVKLALYKLPFVIYKYDLSFPVEPSLSSL